MHATHPPNPSPYPPLLQLRTQGIRELDQAEADFTARVRRDESEWRAVSAAEAAAARPAAEADLSLACGAAAMHAIREWEAVAAAARARRRGEPVEAWVQRAASELVREVKERRAARYGELLAILRAGAAAEALRPTAEAAWGVREAVRDTARALRVAAGAAEREIEWHTAEEEEEEEAPPPPPQEQQQQRSLYRPPPLPPKPRAVPSLVLSVSASAKAELARLRAAAEAARRAAVVGGGLSAEQEEQQKLTGAEEEDRACAPPSPWRRPENWSPPRPDPLCPARGWVDRAAMTRAKELCVELEREQRRFAEFGVVTADYLGGAAAGCGSSSGGGLPFPLPLPPPVREGKFGCGRSGRERECTVFWDQEDYDDDHAVPPDEWDDARSKREQKREKLRELYPATTLLFALCGETAPPPTAAAAAAVGARAFGQVEAESPSAPAAAAAAAAAVVSAKAEAEATPAAGRPAKRARTEAAGGPTTAGSPVTPFAAAEAPAAPPAPPSALAAKPSSASSGEVPLFLAAAIARANLAEAWEGVAKASEKVAELLRRAAAPEDPPYDVRAPGITSLVRTLHRL